MHELKARLSRYVAQARSGEVVEITSHDKPVARLIGIPPADSAGVGSLLASGAAHWRGGKPAPGLPVKLAAVGKPLSEIVLEDRG